MEAMVEEDITPYEEVGVPLRTTVQPLGLFYEEPEREGMLGDEGGGSRGGGC